MHAKGIGGVPVKMMPREAHVVFHLQRPSHLVSARLFLLLSSPFGDEPRFFG